MDSRRDFLTGVGAGSGALAAGWLAWNQYHNRSDPDEFPGLVSYAQAGEDVLMAYLYERLSPLRSYLDIGAFHPSFHNNTYFFYRQGVRGVLVEPNVDMVALLRRQRPEDQVLGIGIGVDDTAEADYYVMSLATRSTFSKEEAEYIEKQSAKAVYIKEVVKMPLRNINRVIAEHFAGRAPDLFSTDTEGFDLAILQSLDFDRYRPRLFCVETQLRDTWQINDQIYALMASKGYTAVSRTLPNTIFVDGKLIDVHR